MFTHLHVHNHFSYLDGFGTEEEYIKRAKELGMTHLAITNHGNVDGNIKFQKACKKAGITPIHGCELYVIPDEYQKPKGEKRGHIIVLVKNAKGWQNLCQMLTIAHLEGFYYRPRIGYKNFLERCEGLVVLTGCSSSFLAKDTTDKALDFVSALYDKIGSDLYLETMPHRLEEQDKQNALCLDFQGQVGNIKLVATNDCHYIHPDEAESQEVLLAIQTKKKWSETDRYRFTIRGLYLKSEEEMRRAFKLQAILSDSQIDQAFASTMEIAEKCQFLIPKQDISLPKVPGYENEDPGKFIWDLAEKKLLKISENWSTEKINIYLDRLSEEWKLINSKNFSQYFMIIWELTSWCRKNKIPVGPGRGSVGGSLLAYLLEITTCLDPIEYHLLFSRFIAEDRIDYPDIDLDFADIERLRIREHLEALYGKDHISSLSTFTTMKGRGCVRDVCRVFEVPIYEVDALAKSIFEDPESDESGVENVLKNTDFGKVFLEKNPKVCQHILKLEGQCRGAGQHAAAIMISGESLRNGTRGNLVMRSEETVTNWDMGDSEYVGLMKLDVLGLNTLSVLEEAKRLIIKNSAKTGFDFDSIPLNDEKVYQSLYEGNTNGVFQFSAWATTNLAKQLKATNIFELADIIALVRPGPADSGQTDLYIKRKNEGLEWQPKHQIYEEITRNTFGIIVYQEQVMEVIHKVAGLPYATADKIRKIIGKKRDVKEFQPYKDAFIQGCAKMKTLSHKEAEEFWEMLEKHAHYSFNKSHSIAYALIGYWTSWIKVHFPVEFICASLTYGSESKKEDLLQEAFDMGLKIITPKIGISDATVWVAKDDSLYIPFNEIKGVGDTTAKKLSEVKEAAIPIRKGFFWPTKQIKAPQKSVNKKVDSLLAQIAEAENTSKDLSEFFSFKIPSDRQKNYDILKRTIPQFDGNKRWLNLDVPEIKSNQPLIYEKSFVPKRSLGRCNDCELHKECDGPVPSSPGIFNVGIIGEAPGFDENQQKKGFVGKSGKMLWDELIKYDLRREDFHVGNAAKCYPGINKTPSAEQLKICSEKWLFPELKEIDCKLILAFGNCCLQAFMGKKSGITQISGTTEWCEKAGAWICFCVHPAFVLRSPENKNLFKSGIKNFVDKIRLLEG
jgi:DNA polymerase-3 subunit alpha